MPHAISRVIPEIYGWVQDEATQMTFIYMQYIEGAVAIESRLRDGTLSEQDMLELGKQLTAIMKPLQELRQARRHSEYFVGNIAGGPPMDI